VRLTAGLRAAESRTRSASVRGALTAAESEALELARQGLKNAEIAGRRGTSLRTVAKLGGERAAQVWAAVAPCAQHAAVGVASRSKEEMTMERRSGCCYEHVLPGQTRAVCRYPLPLRRRTIAGRAVPASLCDSCPECVRVKPRRNSP
jgi:DNA-binding CsgD family transcriptional regulator